MRFSYSHNQGLMIIITLQNEGFSFAVPRSMSIATLERHLKELREYYGR